MHEILTAVANTAAKDPSLIKEVYEDTLQPTAKNVGQALGTLSSTLNVLLAPFSWAVYGFQQIDAVVKENLRDKLSNTPIEDLKEPEPNIVIPAYEALRYSLNKTQLKEMYINLIAQSMQNSTSDKVHPAFVEVIKQLSSFDAYFLKSISSELRLQIPKIKIRLQISEDNFSGIDVYRTILSPKYFTDKSLLSKYSFALDNLERLKLINIDDTYELGDNNLYDEIINSIDKEAFSKKRPDLTYVNLIKGKINITDFGRQFISSVF